MNTFVLAFAIGTVVGGMALPIGTAAAATAQKADAPPQDMLAQLTGQSGSFTLGTQTSVLYGTTGRFAEKSLQPGRYTCGDALFGDPAPGQNKSCYTRRTTPLQAVDAPYNMPLKVKQSTSTAPAAKIAIAPPPPTYSVADPDAYRKTAALFGTEAGITYRYGMPSIRPTVTTTYPGPRASRSFATLSGQRKEVQRDGVAGNRGCGPGPEAWCGSYQIGDFLTGDPGDYSSSIVNVGYLPDVPPKDGWPEPKYWGVASLQTVAVAHNTIAWKPEASWTTYGGPNRDNGANDANTVRLAGARDGSPIGTADLDAKPVASVRGYGRGGWVNNTLTVFANGWITSSGSNTSHNFMKVKLPEGKTPTAMTITNSGEFALVTVWDTAAFKGQIAVIALTDGCAFCETKPESQWEANWGSHRGRYPGLPGLGNYMGAKIVGFVDLPDSLRAPTEISASTGKTDAQYQRVRNFFKDHLQSEANRRRYDDGELESAIARTGMAVVVSKSEKRAAFVDLRPLFAYYRAQYLVKDQAGWNTLMASRGDSPDQWPFSFDVAPAQRPTIAKVIDLPQRPTAVRMTMEPPYRAFIATEEGKLRVFDLGERYLDQRARNQGSPADIRERFSLDVGANPTSIAYVKEKAAFGPGNSSALFGTVDRHRFLWVLSRTERKAVLLKFDAGMDTASVFKSLQDSRMIDPIALEDVDNHGTESYIVTVADYGGEAIHNYAYGPVIMWTYDPKKAPCPKPDGCRLQGNEPFEYAGSARLPGKPFHLSGGNIN